MRKILTLSIAIAAAATVTTAALAADPITPFPAPQVGQLFVAAQTVTADGAVGNFFAPGAKVIFRAYAVDGKTKKLQVAKNVKYFYVVIPNQPNVKLTYNPTATGATKRMAWTGTWTVPATYPEGIVGFKILIKSDAKRHGQFVQFPVSTSQLTISKSPPPTFTSGSAAPAAGTPDVGSLDVSLYVDSVNGTRPAAAKPRPVGCTQTNVYKRGEQFVLRSWGIDTASGDVLSSENIDTATAAIPGQPALTLNWGAHGATTNRVWFWTNAWNIPTDYPLGEATIHVVFKTDAGKTGIFDYSITIIP
jgi:hypothetical protein